MSNPIEPNPAVIESTLRGIRSDLPQLEAAIEAKDWHLVKKLLNTIHLDARESRDYLYRCEGA